MYNDMEGGQALKPIIVIIPYENEFGIQEEIHTGYLTSDYHAMFVEITDHSRRIVFVAVEATHDPNVYVSPYGWRWLGELDDTQDPASVVKVLTEKLKNISAYEFFTKVVIHVKDDIQFGDWIIPKMMY